MNKQNLLIIYCFCMVAACFYLLQKEPETKQERKIDPQWTTPKIEEKVLYPKVTTSAPNHLSYEQIVSLMRTWEKEAPEFVELKTYGKSFRGLDLVCAKIGRKGESNKPKVMIMSCIHGNEPLATAVAMRLVGSLLSEAEKDDAVKELLDKRELLFVPVVSPDTYAKTRLLNGFDPNRDFPGPHDPNHRSMGVIEAIQELFIEEKPKAVMSCHTWGRVFLTPYGDNIDYCPDHQKYTALVGEMAKRADYGLMRTCELYRTNGKLNVQPIRTTYLTAVGSPKPIYGTENDWFYRQGAFSVVVELGTHQRIPTQLDIDREYSRTKEALYYFLKEAPLVELAIKQSKYSHRLP